MLLRITSIVAVLVLGLLVLGLGTWGSLAIVLTGLDGDRVRLALAALFALLSLGTLCALCMARWRWRALLGYLLPLAGLLYWYQGIEPSNSRDWQTDVALLPYATIAGDQIKVHNIRNFDYRSETDYTPAYYDKTFDLSKLEGVDLVASYWMGPAIAHVFLSFAFADGEHLAVSIETRKEKGESYSTLKGFFRQYELYYVVADERDVIRVRTNYRRDPPEQVYLYRLKAPIENGRRLFLEYLQRMNALKARPEFYNTLTTNCTTQIWMNTRVNPQHVPLDWKLLASGYVPEYLYQHDRLESTGQAFSDVRRQALINPRAAAADGAADFSRLIRTAASPQ
ncbi:MAG: DUF4105 domain-containing protein [Pseudomonadota bacterium]